MMNNLKRVYRKIYALAKGGRPYVESYAQTGEDVITYFIFKNILQKPTFTYFDIGAHHPTYLSNTYLFYKAGMRGVSIEPDPILHSELTITRPEDRNLNVGVCFSQNDNVAEKLDFYIMSVRTLNTFSKQEAERLDAEGTYRIKEVKKIPVVHIHQLFRDYFVPDFLSIDVEGLDFEILKSMDLSQYRPNVICVETAEFDPVPPGKKEYEAIDYLKSCDYIVYADTFNNTIFIDQLYLKSLYPAK